MMKKNPAREQESQAADQVSDGGSPDGAARQGHAAPPDPARKINQKKPAGENQDTRSQFFKFEPSLETIIIRESNKLVTINEGKRKLKLSAAKAIVRMLCNAGLEGDLRAQRAFLEVLARSDEIRRVRTEKQGFDFRFFTKEEIRTVSDILTKASHRKRPIRP
jgi:hypothetical protein